MPIAIEPFSDLIFVYMPGCAACEEAMPELNAFAAKHPNLMIVHVRADGPMVERLLGRLKIRATPTYVYRTNGSGVTREGAMTAKQIAEWIDSIIARESGDAE